LKNFVLGIAFTVAVLVIGGLGYLLLGFAEVRGDLPPSRIENTVMRRAVHASVRREAPEVPNPFPPSDENLIAGGKVYLNECAGCHGTPGKPEEYPGVLFWVYALIQHHLRAIGTIFRLTGTISCGTFWWGVPHDSTSHTVRPIQ